MVKTDSGKYYVYPSVRERDVSVFKGPFMRKDWLDELKMSPPSTIDEWYNTLKAFKEKKSVPAPLAFQFIDTIGPDLAEAFVGAYGIGMDYYIDDAGKVKYGSMDPKFKDVLLLFKKWFSEGLILL